MRVGGIYSFVTTDQPAAGQWMHLVVTFAAHKIRKVDQIFIDYASVDFREHDIDGSVYGWARGVWDLPIPDQTSYLFASCVNNGAVNQPANPNLVGQSAILFPSLWTEAHRQAGNASVYFIMYYDPIRYPNGNPTIQIEGDMKADIFDPRNGITGYTNNGALCIADYITQADWGCSADFTNEVDWENIKYAADVCDITINGVPQYKIDGVFSLSSATNPIDILRKMASAIGGDVVFTSGRWKVFPGAWREPAITLTADDIRGSMSLTTHLDRTDAFNTVTGKFVGPWGNWQETNYPAVTNALYLAEDGEEITQDITLPFTNDVVLCQRIAKIYLEQARQGIYFERVFSLKAYQLELADNVYINDPDFGWIAKAFKVVTWELQTQSAGSVPEILVKLGCQETAPGVYLWNNGEQTTVDVAPNTNLPDPNYVLPPTNVVLDSSTAQLLKRTDGSIITRVKITWTPTADPYVKNDGNYQIQWQVIGSTEWTDTTPIPGSNSLAYISDAPDGVFINVRIRSRNGIGNPSSWVTINGYFVIGQTANPTTPTNFSAVAQAYGIYFSWTPITDVDADAYIIRLGTTWSEDPATIVTIEAHPKSNYTWNIKAAGTYNFIMRAVDRSGNESGDCYATVEIQAPGMVEPAFRIIGGDLLLTWPQVAAGQFAVRDYEIRYGDIYADSILVAANVAGTTYTLMIAWGGSRRFWISARDVALNLGMPAPIDVVVQVPTAVRSLSAEVVDNNVLLRWLAPDALTVPIKVYKIFKGDVFASADLVGESAGTFTTVFEQASGTYSYYVQPIDTAGNIGPASKIMALVNQPPDYKLQYDQEIDLSTVTLTNAVVVRGGIVAPVILGRTWAEHFADNGWNTLRDQANAGFPIYVQPSNPTVAFVEKVIDFGAVLPATIATLQMTRTDQFGNPVVVIRFFASTDGVTYTSGISGPSALIPDLRYLKIRIEINALVNSDLTFLEHLRLKLAVKLRTDSGTANAVASDVGGTTIPFNISFIDVDGPPTVTPNVNGSAYKIAVAITNFLDGPYPVDFKVLVYDADPTSPTNGQRIDLKVGWLARGIAR